MTDELLELSACEIAAKVADRSLSATEVMAAYLARIETVNPVVNAICTLNPVAETDAAKCDQRLAAGELARPLEGVPFVVKDTIETQGVRTTFGSRIMENNVPSEDAIAVARLKATGAILIGKANTPEFATDVNTTNAIFGMTRNPWDLNTTSGGSSGGPAAALAAGMAPIGLGTDLGGSIRIPASFNGVVGLRPVPGRVPIYPQEFGWDTLIAHVCGPMARKVEDIGLVLAAIAGPDDRDPSSLPTQGYDYARAATSEYELAGRTIAFAGNLNGLFPVDPEVLQLCRDACGTFRDLGCTVEEDCFDVSEVLEIISGTRAFNMVARYADRLDSFREIMSKALVNQVEPSLKVKVRAVVKAERLRTVYWHRVREFLNRYDYIVTPTIGVSAFRLDRPLPTEVGGIKVERFYDVLLSTYAFSITGLPVISVPCGWTKAGLPVGLQIVGPRLREELVLMAAGAFARLHPDLFKLPAIDLESANPIHPDFLDTFSKFVGSAARL